MSNPSLITCPKDTWTKVAANVTFGYVYIKEADPCKYLHTYRMAGETAPTSLDIPEALALEDSAKIRSMVNIDVYIMPVGADGKVRVDL